MFQRILVPLDGSCLAECVMPHLIAIARVNGASMTLIRVLDPKEQGFRVRNIDPLDWQIRKAEAEAYMETWATRLKQADLKANYEILEGKAAESIIEYSHVNNNDLIILSSHGQSGLSGWNVSSVVQKIIQRAETSLLIVRAYQPVIEDVYELHYKRILVPLDGSQRAEIVLPAATTLANAYGAELLIVHVIKGPEMPRRTPPTHEDLELSQRIIERNRVEATRYLEELSMRLQSRLDARLIVDDNVSAALHNTAGESGVDLTILSAHGYAGNSQWRYGSTVISFIAYGATPLLIFQDFSPESFSLTQAEIAARESGGR